MLTDFEPVFSDSIKIVEKIAIIMVPGEHFKNKTLYHLRLMLRYEKVKFKFKSNIEILPCHI